jgi:F-type H+-transporting ATPase subunit gamma
LIDSSVDRAHTDIHFPANISSYEVDDEALSSLREYALANNLFWAMAEGHACEISARRNAMENASKNAGEMINKYVVPD